MAGLEQIAAIVGLTEFGFRSIFSLYNAIKDLRNVPEEIENIQIEIDTLQECLVEFQIQTTDNEHIAAAIKRFGFPRALKHCEQACTKLNTNLHLWKEPQDRSWRKRIGYFVHKKETVEVLTAIRNAKDTLILTIVGSQLSLQSQSQITLEEIAYQMSSDPKWTRENTVLSGQGKALQLPSQVAVPSSQNAEASTAANTQDTRTVQEFKKKVDDSGSNNKIGMTKEANGLAIAQTWHGEVSSSGSNSTIGIW